MDLLHVASLTALVKDVNNVEKIKAGGAVALNELMTFVKALEETAKSIRKTCTDMVKETGMKLPDYELVEYDKRNLKDPVGLSEDLYQRWHVSYEEQVQKGLLKVQLEPTTAFLVKLVTDSGEADNLGITADRHVTNAMAKFMDKPTSVVSLKSKK